MLRKSAVLAAVLLLSSCLQSDTLGFFEVSLDVKRAYEMWIKDTNVRRWNKDVVTVSISGGQKGVDDVFLSEALTDVSATEGLPLLSMVPSDGDISVTVSPRATWPSSDSDKSENTIGKEAGLTLSKWEKNGSLLSASVFVDSSLSPTQRRRTITHELLHALGAGHHDCPGALMYFGIDKNPDWRIPDFDRTLLSLSYDKKMISGVSFRALRDNLIVKDGTRCPSIEFETTHTDSQELWCKVVSDPQPCYSADARVLPGDGPVVLWRQKDVLYSYDPSVYQAFSTDSGRVLCFLPPLSDPSSWVQCERTEKPEISSPTLWTDGTTISQVPPS